MVRVKNTQHNCSMSWKTKLFQNITILVVCKSTTQKSSWPDKHICHQCKKKSDCCMWTTKAHTILIIRYLKSIVVKLAPCKISILQLLFIAEQASLSLTWLQTPKTDFLSSMLVKVLWLWLWMLSVHRGCFAISVFLPFSVAGARV